eukprot:12415553-Karenia_brevis.AAC.1
MAMVIMMVMMMMMMMMVMVVMVMVMTDIQHHPHSKSIVMFTLLTLRCLPFSGDIPVQHN